MRYTKLLSLSLSGGEYLMKKFLFLFAACLLLINWHVAQAQEGEASKAHPFDSYGRVGSEDASARLDNFAVELMSKPQMNGYVICYGPEGKGSGTGKYLTEIQKSYLVKTRGLDAGRIQTLYGGRYKTQSE